MESPAALAIPLLALAGIVAQWLGWRLRIPAIVLLSGAGLLLGPGLGWLQPSRDFGSLLDPMVSFAVSIILFEGGLRLKLHDLREAARGVRRLCTVGLLLSWGLGTCAAHFVGGLELEVASIFGAILTVTGPTVIMPLLRQARLKRGTASLFKWEAIVNDPSGALLTVIVFEFVVHGGSAGSIARSLGVALVAGGGLGWLVGHSLAWAFRHGHVPEFLKAPALMAAVFGVFAAANALQHEAGLLAVTVMGVVIGNFGLASIAELTRFKDALSLTLVSAVFVLLTADMDPSTLAALSGRHMALLAAVLFLVRPGAVLLSTVGAGMQRNDRLLLAWIAPRGVVAAAVAGVFGPRLVDAGYEDGALLVPLVFATILLTVVLHGFSLAALARKLGLSAGRTDGLLFVGASPWVSELALLLKQHDIPVLLADTSWTRLQAPRLAGVPCHYGEVLSEAAEQSLPLNETNLVLAASNNDAYNALVCVHFGPELGRNRVYQLAHPDIEAEGAQALATTARGRVFASDRTTYDQLRTRHWEGWTFRATPLGEAYGMDEWRRDTGESAEMLMLLGPDGSVQLHGPRFPLEPGPGDTLVAHVPPKKAQLTGRDARKLGTDS